MRKEVWGWRVYENIGGDDIGPLFAPGRDADLEGLRAPNALSEEPPEHIQTGRTIRCKEVLHTPIDDFEVFDQNLGESGSFSDEEAERGLPRLYIHKFLEVVATFPNGA